MLSKNYQSKLEIIFEEKIIGGLADNKTLEDICKKHGSKCEDIQKQLDKGIEFEKKEHTSDPKIAEEIAKDHLWEDPIYYDKLEKMEKGQCNEKTQHELNKKIRRDWGGVKPVTKVIPAKKGKGSYDRKYEKRLDEKIPKNELEPVNPFAVCTKNVGREKKDKYERCVMDVKAKNRKENK